MDNNDRQPPAITVPVMPGDLRDEAKVHRLPTAACADENDVFTELVRDVMDSMEQGIVVWDDAAEVCVGDLVRRRLRQKV